MKRKVFIAGCALAVVAAGCLAVAFLFASPAAAQRGIGDKVTLKAWDTDNLAGGGLSARNYRIPFHDYGGYVDRTPRSRASNILRAVRFWLGAVMTAVVLAAIRR